MSATQVSITEPETDTTPDLDQLHLQAARLWVALHRPYYAAALYRCPVVASTSTPTMAIDARWRIYLNPDYVARLSVPRFAAGLIHEINHVLRDHHHRARCIGVTGDDGLLRWNIAGDAEINDDLRDDDLDVDLHSWIFPGRLGSADDLTAEIYYEHLESPASLSTDCGSGSGGRRLPGELDDDDQHRGVSDGEATIIKTNVAREVTRYHQPGSRSVPDGLLRWAEEQLTPIIDWRQVLAGEIRGSVASASDTTDYSFQRFSRRAAAFPDVRLAGRLRHLPEVAVVIDTSGSMAEEMIRQVVTEVEGLLQTCGVANDSLTFILVDSSVSLCQRISRLPEKLPMNRGGTDMTVGITRALKGAVRPDVIIVLTDGYTGWPPAPIPGVSIIAGIIRSPDEFADHRPPKWISTVHIPFE